ncbi:hypothetical protein Pint_13568 [Pistacia integerrima]|uniref:Uncharacterized protein n=1 Tax=Pistacia integerrima TaxID=434235 RepID=A0ACC0Y7X7_9ROSI|nr:hypothetical protein Pint_13568 [Pistacia integerrima]
MLISRLLRAGAWMVKELSKDSYSCVSRTGCTSQQWRPLFSSQSESKVFQGSMFQKYLHFSTTAANDAGDEGSEQKDMISVTFVDKDGEEKNIKDVEQYNRLEDPTDEENDMLDLAFGLTEMSRLGCQIIARPELDGIRLAIPAATRNFAVDGYVPKPH